MASLDILPVTIVAAPIDHRSHTAFGMYLDEDSGVIRTETHGCWTPEETEDYAAELADLIAECRRRFGRVRVLSDRRGSTAQPPAVADRLGEINATLFLDGDRLALVVDSSLAKGQMRRRFSHAGSQAFLSHTAAELWLSAWP